MRIISGKLRGKPIETPPLKTTRPTSDRTREMIFNILQHNPLLGGEVIIGKKILDIFAGSGAMGIEAFSRGATLVTFIENNHDVSQILKQNIVSAGLPIESLLLTDALKLPKSPHAYDLVFLDPPYHKGLVIPSLERIKDLGWIHHQSLIVLEISQNEELSLPPSFQSILERKSGAAKIMFIKLS